MNVEVYGLLTFKTTSLALEGEQMLKEKDISFKTIPTPRVVSHSCGLALLFAYDDIDNIKEMIEEDKIHMDNLYKFVKDKGNDKADKIL